MTEEITETASETVAESLAEVESPPTHEGAQSDDGKSEPQEGCTFKVMVGETEYTVTHQPWQLEAIRAIILPKPISDETNAAQITADHIQSVKNAGDLLIAEIAQAVADHDSRKLNQTQEEHHREWHHWPLDGGPKAVSEKGFLPLQYAVEAWCDYVATVYGRYFAGRGIDWLRPTSKLLIGDSLSATHLYFLDRLGLAEITPPIPGGEEDA